MFDHRHEHLTAYVGIPEVNWITRRQKVSGRSATPLFDPVGLWAMVHLVVWSPDDRRPPEGLAACAISSRSTHSTLTGASCIAERTSSPSRRRCSTCSIT